MALGELTPEDLKMDASVWYRVLRVAETSICDDDDDETGRLIIKIKIMG